MITMKDVKRFAENLSLKTDNPAENYVNIRTPRNNVLYTAKGAREAMVWLLGYQSCVQWGDLVAEEVKGGAT